MTAINTDEIRARADAATPGPWIHRYYERITTSNDTDGSKSVAHVYDKNLGNFGANIDFISHARTDIPALCDAYEAQAKEIERLTTALNHVLLNKGNLIEADFDIVRSALSAKLAKELSNG